MKKFKISKRVELYTIFTILVLVTMIGSTVSLFLKTDTVSNAYYQTGLINIELIDDETGYGTVIDLNRSVPVSDEVGSTSSPYKVKITNNGTVNYQFDVQLLNDAIAIANDNCENNLFDKQYIKIKVNDSVPVQLSLLTNGTILTNQTLAPGETMEVTLRAWLTTNTPNSQIGKHFHVKLVADGHATYTERTTNLSGYIYQSNDTICASCNVSLTEDLTTTTNTDGYFELTNVPIKQYNLIVTQNSTEIINTPIKLYSERTIDTTGTILFVEPDRDAIFKIKAASDKSILAATRYDIAGNIMDRSITETNQLYVINQPTTTQVSHQVTDYRYYGATPNNYVWYNCKDTDNNGKAFGASDYTYSTTNCEKWRIIGVFETETPVYTNGEITSYKIENRVKIIRDESLGDYSFDSSASTINDGYGINAWEQADLMTTLNGIYMTKGSGTCYNNYNNATTLCNFSTTGLNAIAKTLAEPAKYYLGGTEVEQLTSVNYVGEMGTTYKSCTKGTTCNDTYDRLGTWTGMVGLMYPSDYGYAAGSTCANNTILYSYNSTCKSSDWLYKSGIHQWTLSPVLDSFYATRVFFVHSSGLLGNYGASLAFGVRPVLYLSSDVVIKDGLGTSEQPFIIGK